MSDTPPIKKVAWVLSEKVIRASATEVHAGSLAFSHRISKGVGNQFNTDIVYICFLFGDGENPHEPHFFKPLLPSFQSGVTIPLAFFSKHIEGKTNQKTWKLRSDASDQTWEVIQEDRTLTRGDMVFHVTPFGPSCCEIQYTHPHIIKEEADAGDADDNEIINLNLFRIFPLKFTNV
ncbi:hypothetical protein Bca52824_063999 [Brassica carinata]|uniref:Uncharacterized protein n=1 Tax=Brassica carinata TaxID=52824 RepID=A0A8X7U8P3_BRACI|nr:hypothetical protein Bca52824_063999 [Brassica carinata]